MLRAPAPNHRERYATSMPEYLLRFKDGEEKTIEANSVGEFAGAVIFHGLAENDSTKAPEVFRASKNEIAAYGLVSAVKGKKAPSIG